MKRLTLDFGSSHDRRVVGSSPVSGSVLSVESAWDSLSLSQINKYVIKKIKKNRLELNLGGRPGVGDMTP